MSAIGNRRNARTSAADAHGVTGDAELIKTDVCVIGAGAAGLSVAYAASSMGAKVILIERQMRDGIMGGECLHTGCVPSKALLAAGKRAHGMEHANAFGIANVRPQVDFEAVIDHVHGVIDQIGPVDSVERYQGIGADVMEGHARFINPRTIEIEGLHVEAKRFVIATGSRPALPPIPGLKDVPYLTNETIFENRVQPDHLIIIGAGPIGMELAQAHRRLGSTVSVLERDKALPNDDPDLTKVVIDRVTGEGVKLHEHVQVEHVSQDSTGLIHVRCIIGGKTIVISGSHLLVAAGRQPVLDELGLEAAGIAYAPQGITVNGSLRTSNSRVWAVGDCVAGSPRFTHVASYHASVVIRNLLFRVPAKTNLEGVPWVTYTDPELAHAGLTEKQAKERHKDVQTITFSYDENDRAIAERETTGFIKVVARKNGRILGVSIVGAHAGEVIQPWLLALSKKMKLSDMTGYIAPYPTLGELNKRVAGKFFTPVLFGPRVRSVVRTLLKLP